MSPNMSDTEYNLTYFNIVIFQKKLTKIKKKKPNSRCCVQIV